MLKRAISLVCALALAGCAAGGGAAASHTAKINVSGENRYKAARLTPEVMNASNGDLSDIRVTDGSGENIPYFINTGYEKAYSSTETHRMALINSYVKDDSFYFDYELAETQFGDTVATSVEFITRDTDFAKEIEVYGSYDNTHWEYVQNDKIYSVDDKIKLSVEFSKPQKFTCYRFKLSNNQEMISFDYANLVYSVETSEGNYFIESFEPAFSIKAGEKTTEVIIEGLKNLWLCDATFHTGSMFKRSFRAPDGIETELYNLSTNGESYADTALPLHWNVSRDDAFVVTVYDGDDKPIEITGVTVRYYAADVVFDGSAEGGYTLEFGGGAEKTAPVYDIAQYSDEILRGGIDRAELFDIQYSAVSVKPERDYGPAFNIAVVAVTLLLGAVILMRLRKK